MKHVITIVALFSLGMSAFAQTSDSSQIPKECAQSISADTGRPVMFPQRHELVFGIPKPELIFGISAKPLNLANDPIPVVLWIYNPTDKALSAMTCSDIDYFWREAMDVFDSSGHRVRAKGEVEIEQQGRSEWINVCGRNFGIEIKPHSCKHSLLSAPVNDLIRDLRSNYDLAPGRYFVVPSERTPQHVPVERIVVNPKVGLEINIQAVK